MKKLFAVALALVLSVGIFAGCNASGAVCVTEDWERRN